MMTDGSERGSAVRVLENQYLACDGLWGCVWRSLGTSSVGRKLFTAIAKTLYAFENRDCATVSFP